PSRSCSCLLHGRRHRQSKECIPRLLSDLERRRPRHPHPEGSQSGVREAAMRSTATVVITAWVISLLVLLLAAIFLIRFRKRWVAAFNLAVTNRITSRFAARLPVFGILDTRRSKVRQAPPHASECFSSAGGIPDCAHLRTGKRVGQEC